MSEPTSRRLMHKGPPQHHLHTSMSSSPPGSSHSSSEQCSLGSCNSATFQILSVAQKWESDDEDEEGDEQDEDLQLRGMSPTDLPTPLACQQPSLVRLRAEPNGN